jgi:uncharacterized OB-fold protein
MNVDTTVSIARPAIVSVPLTQPFWDAANEGTLLVQRCDRCGHVQHYPRNICVKCWSHELQWVVAAGTGTIWTFTVVNVPGHPAWSAEVPYVLALVELDEGPRLMTNIIGCDPNDVQVGQRVVLTPSRPSGSNQTLMQFSPSSSGR